MKKIISMLFAFTIAVHGAQAQNLDYIVTGAKTGSVVLAAQLLDKDSQAGLLGGTKLSLNVPGDACKAFALVVESQSKETFLTSSDNLYTANATLKQDSLCPLPDFKNATPVITEIQGMYMMVPKDFDIKSVKGGKLKIGYAFDNQLYRGWHQQLNSAFGQDHTFIGYNGSGSLIKGLLSGEIDGIWQTWTAFGQLEKAAPGQYKIVYRTMKDRKMDSIPLITEEFKNPKLERGFVSTLWIFNDRNKIATKLRSDLKNVITTGSGAYGEWTRANEKSFVFDIAEQNKLIQTNTWLGYQN
jgi:hypothetical protein